MDALGLAMIVVEAPVMKAIIGDFRWILVLHHGRKIEFARPNEVAKNPE